MEGLPEEESIEDRICADVVARSFSSSFVFLAIWPMLSMILTDFYKNDLSLTINFTLAFTFVGLLRWFQPYLFRRYYKVHKKAFVYFFNVSTLLPAFLWSYLISRAYIDPTFDSLLLALNLTTAGIAAGAVNCYAPRLKLSNIYVSIMLCPVAVVVATHLERMEVTFVITSFWLYLMFIGKRLHAEYIASFENEMKLKQNQKLLQHQSRTDSLVKLRNRLSFNESLEYFWKQSTRTQLPISLGLIDVDHFKKVNDHYGHMAGDKCLIHIAKHISATIKRSTDMAFRYGGEEFAILLPNIGFDNALVLCEEIRGDIEKAELDVDGQCIHNTVSIGVCTIVPSKEDNRDVFIMKVDAALYSAKAMGRNRIEGHDYSRERVHAALEPH